MRIEVDARIILTTEAAEAKGLRAVDIVLAAEQKINGLSICAYPEDVDSASQTPYGIRVHMNKITEVIK